MKEKEGQREEQRLEGGINSGCDVNADRCLEEQSKKKRDTSFVDARKKQIELYGNYYPAGLSDVEITVWSAGQQQKLNTQIENLKALSDSIYTKIESDRQAKLSATLAGLSETEKEQLKAMLA